MWLIFRSIQVTFKNITSNRSLAWYQPALDPPWISDEVAFEMLMNARPDEMESTMSRLDFMTTNLFEQRIKFEDESGDV